MNHGIPFFVDLAQPIMRTSGDKKPRHIVSAIFSDGKNDDINVSVRLADDPS
jgi:hypothetical protein